MVRMNIYFKIRFYFFGLLVGVCCVFFVSCGESVDGKHPLFIKAESFYNEGDYDSAIPLYQKYLDINPASSKAVYRLAGIFQQKQDYVQAIFYYKKYLTLNPDSSDGEVIKKWLDASSQALALQLSTQYHSEFGVADSSRKSTEEKEIIELKAKNAQLRQVVSNLQTEAQNVKPATTEIAPAPNLVKQEPQAKPEQSVKHYTVQEGDTLQSISMKFYGSSKYYKIIIEANKDTLKNPNSLKIGDKIIIPPKSIAKKKSR